MSTNWADFSDDALLKVRIRDLKLKWEHSRVHESIQKVLDELKNTGLLIQPKIYLGDEWFSPEGCLSISVPFYLAHPRLIELEKKMMLEAEGADPQYFLKLLRHECGHCFDHAYQFSKRAQWKEIFGNPDQEYQPELYRPRPFSRSFVKNLDNWYAQSHPDEDFAETFAVWLDPDVDYRKVYDDWPQALRKLEYMEKLVQEARKKPPKFVEYDESYSARKMKATLHTYYQRKMSERAEDYPSVFDEELCVLFHRPEENEKPSDTNRKRDKNAAAANFLKKHRKNLVETITYWTGERKYTVDSLLKRLITRTETLKLELMPGAAQNPEKLILQISSFLTSAVNRHLFTGKFKRHV